MFFLMSNSLKLPFSVAKFTIEGPGEGAVQSNQSLPAPPRLSGSQTILDSRPKLSFSNNPFSLSRNSSSYLHGPSDSSKNLVGNTCTNIPPLASAPLKPSSPYVNSLFPNLFLIERNSDSQKNPSHTSKSHTAPPKPSPQNVVQPPKNFTNSSTSFSHAATKPFTALRKPRKPRPDRVLAPSTFRPQVMAADRLFSWRTPYGLSHDESLLAELPPGLVESAKMSITGALATSSKSTYAAGLLRFNQFCDRWEISEVARMPASYALLCAFIGNYKGSNSGRTIKSWLSGIRAWHLTNHAPWYGDDKWVQMARISANKEGSRHKRPLRAPVSIEHLLALQKAITPSNHFHAAIWAVALVSFFGCRRLGETTVTSVSSFDPNYHVLRSAKYVCT